MIKIVNIRWINEAAKEAEVSVSNGKSIILCFSQPFNYHINDVLTLPIYCYDVRIISKSIEAGFEIVKLGQPFDYHLKGKLVNHEDKIVDLDGYQISLDDADLPGDINNGDTIEFVASRLDIY